MASQVTPPSSSPTRSDPVQPKTATPFAPHQDAWPGSAEPPPKRRRKGPSVGGASEGSDLQGDGLTLSRQDGHSGEPQQPRPVPALQPNNAASPARPPPVKAHVRQTLAEFTQFYPGAPGSTKVQPHIRPPLADFTRLYPRPSNPPAVKHVRRPLADFTLLYRRASNPAKSRPEVAGNEPEETAATGHHRAPVAASTTLQNGTQSGRPHGPATTTASESRHTRARPPVQPAWNSPAPAFAHAQEEQHRVDPSNFGLSTANPIFQRYYPGGQPVFQEQQGSWQQDYAYNMPTQTHPFVGHASQVHHTQVAGTADRPILVDDWPVQPVYVPAASTQTQKHQGFGGGMPVQPKLGVEDKENTFVFTPSGIWSACDLRSKHRISKWCCPRFQQTGSTRSASRQDIRAEQGITAWTCSGRAQLMS